MCMCTGFPNKVVCEPIATFGPIGQYFSFSECIVKIRPDVFENAIFDTLSDLWFCLCRENAGKISDVINKTKEAMNTTQEAIEKAMTAIEKALENLNSTQSVTSMVCWKLKFVYMHCMCVCLCVCVFHSCMTALNWQVVMTVIILSHQYL